MEISAGLCTERTYSIRDPSAAYSLFQYNPSWAGANILGRYFRVGARVDF